MASTGVDGGLPAIAAISPTPSGYREASASSSDAGQLADAGTVVLHTARRSSIVVSAMLTRRVIVWGDRPGRSSGSSTTKCTGAGDTTPGQLRFACGPVQISA